MKPQTTLVFLMFLMAGTTLAQPVTVGALSDYLDLSRNSQPLTYVDLSHPATGNGSLVAVTFRWGGFLTGCSNNIKFKVVRPSNGFQFTVIAERGPFTATGAVSTVALSPPIPVVAGDLLAITQTAQGNCGGIAFGFGDPANMTVSWPADLQTGTSATPVLERGLVLSARATSDPGVLSGVLAVVGSAAGSFGSSFKTDVQITNVDPGSMTGMLVYHPAGRTGVSSDPSISYSITGPGTVVYPDVVSRLGLSGVGSMDVIATGGPNPVVTTRVYNDQGAAGTNGFLEEMLSPAGALVTFEHAVFQLPADSTNFRMNIGVRSLSSGATMNVYVTDATTGVTSNVTHKIYQPSYFEQVSASAFANTTLPAKGFVSIAMQAGSAIIYASTTDNRTNDSAITFAKHP